MNVTKATILTLAFAAIVTLAGYALGGWILFAEAEEVAGLAASHTAAVHAPAEGAPAPTSPRPGR